MKNVKRLASLLLALVMLLSLAVVASASEVSAPEETEETYSITINNKTNGHTYEAYQIFVGDLANDADNDDASGTEAILSNIQWGASVSDDGKTALGNAAAYAENVADAAAFAKAIAPYLTAPVATSADDGDTYVIRDLTPGYYLVKDKDNSLTGHDSYTSYIIEVVENSTINPKSSVPSVEKKVDDKNDSTTEEDETVWNDSADHDIGDSVPFKLTATLADNVSDYLKYQVVFHDTLSAGLTYNGGAKVYFGETDVTEYFTITEKDGALTISCANVKAFGAGNNAEITVLYTATLNDEAVLGSAGNPNVVYLEYSNNPNWGWDKWEDKDDDGTFDEGEVPDDEKEPTGNTPEDKVIVFTYKVVVNKVDDKGDDLPGAGFTLYKQNADGEYVAIGTELKGEALTTFEWKGLDDGNYKLVETTTPAGYNTIPDIAFTITAKHDLLSADPKLTSLTGGDLFTGEVSTGTLTTDVENKPGTVLPETGGMGTTVFYIAGGVLVAVAVVLLVVKRRMGASA